MIPAAECKAGFCTDCGARTWRYGTFQREYMQVPAGTEVILWPVPSSVYARVQDGENVGVGIGFCGGCAPAPGTVVLAGFGPVVSYETARERYKDWFTDYKGMFYRTWLRDTLSYEPAQVAALMNVWKADRG